MTQQPGITGPHGNTPTIQVVVPVFTAGKAVSDPHQMKSEGPGLVLVISIDYAFMDQDSMRTMAVKPQY